MKILKIILTNPVHKDWYLSKLLFKKTSLRKKLYENSNTYNRELWLTKTKREVCKICKMPNYDSDKMVLESLL